MTVPTTCDTLYKYNISEAITLEKTSTIEYYIFDADHHENIHHIEYEGKPYKSYTFTGPGGGTNLDLTGPIEIHYKNTLDPVIISQTPPPSLVEGQNKTEYLLYNTDRPNRLVLTKSPLSKQNQEWKPVLKKYIISPEIVLNKSNILHTSEMGDYHKHVKLIKTDSAIKMKDTLNDLKKCGKLKDFQLSDALTNESSMQEVIKNLIKGEKDFTCCDKVDLSKFVLKTSVPPCSNVIPDKYKKYGENYNPNSTTDKDDKDDQISSDDIHSTKITDKFSISYIALSILILIIILLNIM
jgi:hypothetical protein